MTTWNIEATRTLSAEFTVEADTREEARELAYEQVSDMTTCSDWQDFETEVVLWP